MNNSDTQQPYRIIGIESSPYAVKVRAVMRYRHLPYVWVSRMPQFFEETQNVRPLIMPVVQFPNGGYRTDSTPIVRELEDLHGNARSIVPADEGLAFLNDLIEDLADEWLTKSLFHYRFSRAEDRQSGASWVMDDAHPQADLEEYEKLTAAFAERQVERMPIVGCTPANAPLIEKFYDEVLAILEPFVQTDRFLFGSRPSLADFGLYAQLKTLGTDPTGFRIMRERAPRTEHWVRRLDDTSGVEGTWDSTISPATAALVELASRYYLPFLAANRAALDNGDAQVSINLDGQLYKQPVYRYQGKCFDFLRSRYAGLSEASKRNIDALFGTEGASALLS